MIGIWDAVDGTLQGELDAAAGETEGLGVDLWAILCVSLFHCGLRTRHLELGMLRRSQYPAHEQEERQSRAPVCPPMPRFP